MKPAPSWSNVAQRTESGTNSGRTSLKTPVDEEVKGKLVQNCSFILFQLI